MITRIKEIREDRDIKQYNMPNHLNIELNGQIHQIILQITHGEEGLFDTHKIQKQ